MTPEDIGKLTIAEVEAITERAGKALTAFREAQALLGGSPVVSAAVAAQRQAGPPPPQLTAAEVGQREKLLRQFKHEGLPEQIKALEEQQQ